MPSASIAWAILSFCSARPYSFPAAIPFFMPSAMPLTHTPQFLFGGTEALIISVYFFK